MKSFRLLILVGLCMLFISNTIGVNFQTDIFDNISDILISDIEEIKKSIELGNLNSSSIGISKQYQYDNEKCVTHFMKFLEALLKHKLWAIKIADSWGKIPSGILYGNVHELGNFDQCLDQEQIDNISSQYCLAVITFKNGFFVERRNSLNDIDRKSTIDISFGICVPSACSPQFLTYLIDRDIAKVNLTSKAFISEMVCQQREFHKEFRTIDLVSIFFFSGVTILMLISTIYDILKTRNKKNKSATLTAFSMYTNGKHIFYCIKRKSPDVLNGLNGIRTFALIGIIYMHTILTIDKVPKINNDYFLNWFSSFYGVLSLSIFYSVDTFLLLSGLLVSWSILNNLDKNNGKFNIFRFYFHRYVRLTPVLATAILFSATLLRHIGSGPIWNKITVNCDEFCNRYWWSTLLYIQNYYKYYDMCLDHTWYLAVDMQLFILSPILLYPMWRWKHKFVWVIPLLIGVSMALNYKTYVQLPFKEYRKNFNWFHRRKTYYPTHIRMGAWLVGMLLGYILHHIRVKGKVVILSKLWITIGWILSIGTILTIICCAYPIWQPSSNIKMFHLAFYETFSRVFWVIAVSWIIFACVHDYGGFLNCLLSLPQWDPIARLSYTIYIVHFPVMAILAGAVRVPIYFSNIGMVHTFFGYFVISFIISLFWAMAFESSFLILEKFVFRNKDKHKSDLK